jgi:hypothetical protein
VRGAGQNAADPPLGAVVVDGLGVVLGVVALEAPMGLPLASRANQRPH